MRHHPLGHSSISLHNNYSATWHNGSIDVGAAAVLNMGKYDIYLTGTLWSVSAGVGVSF